MVFGCLLRILVAQVGMVPADSKSALRSGADSWMGHAQRISPK